jgi:glycosyltransferase involved in cell wall biosynthesis
MISSASSREISIALATYNGGEFIEELLESLVRQRLRPHELVVTDDGSTDRTLEILEAFRARAPFAVRIYQNEQRLGFSENFMKAASLTEGDWIAFCDQDDVWLPHKLERLSAERALVLSHGFWVTDAQLRLRKRRVARGIARGGWYGFTLLFARELLKFPWEKRPKTFTGEGPMYHDEWVVFLGMSLKSFKVVPEPLVLYRQHGKNTSGFQELTWNRVFQRANYERRARRCFEYAEFCRAYNLFEEQWEALGRAFQLREEFYRRDLWGKLGIWPRLWRMYGREFSKRSFFKDAMGLFFSRPPR